MMSLKELSTSAFANAINFKDEKETIFKENYNGKEVFLHMSMTVKHFAGCIKKGWSQKKIKFY